MGSKSRFLGGTWPILQGDYLTKIQNSSFYIIRTSTYDKDHRISYSCGSKEHWDTKTCVCFSTHVDAISRTFLTHAKEIAYMADRRDRPHVWAAPTTSLVRLAENLPSFVPVSLSTRRLLIPWLAARPCLEKRIGMPSPDTSTSAGACAVSWISTWPKSPGDFV